MELTQKIQKAINVAAEKHLGQIRKVDGLPFITHPYTIAVLLSDYTEDEDVICAGLLHDVLEDVKGYGFSNLEKDFGWRVAGIVKEVSEDKDPDIESNQKATWKKRKIGYLEHLCKASKEAMLVSAADKIHNLLSMITAYEKQGAEMWKQFNASPEESLWFYRECLDVLRKHLDSRIVKHFGYTYVLAENIVFGHIQAPKENIVVDEVKESRENITKFEDEEFIKAELAKFEKQFKPRNTTTEDERQEEFLRKHWEFYKYMGKKRFENS